LLPKPSAVQSLLLVQGARIFAVSDLRGIDRSIFQSIAMEPTTTNSVTRIWEKGGLRFLVSEVPLGTADITLISMTPESEALGALNTLFRRSVVFLLFSFFGLIAIALSISRTLTGNIQLLTRSAEEIGRGNFEASPKIDSMDEMGVLARAFGKMSQEIKRLLFETSEKTRMEQELKTASLVQERLLPVLPQARLGDIEISGTVVTSSECGGDWWYYFQKQHELYVAIADATGHGTPAALITAAARSVFSRLEHEVLSLGEMMKAWDFAVSSCAQKQVFMTGIILRIDTRTGKGAYVNAAHESPFYFRQGEGEIACDYLISPSSQRIGDGGHDSMEEGVFELAPGEAIVLYTDGLFSVNRPDGKVLSEKRLGKKLAQKYQSVQSAPALMGIVLSEFNEFRGELPVPDDVSVVSLYRT
jgi:sigma-B regulation protein RsbU (phosphoserine phosphatase)